MRCFLEGRAVSHSSWRSTVLWAALLPAVTATGAVAQPQTAGAIQTLDFEPRSALKQTATSQTACVLDAVSVEQGSSCGSATVCAASVGLPCELGGGLDHVAAGTGLRNSGAGTIELRGVPAGAVPVVAWLYWGVITSVPDDPMAHRVTFNGAELTGSLVGTSREPCWNKNAVFAAYRAAVRGELFSKVNGNYSVTLPVSGSTGGQDPWSPFPAKGPHTEGATLIVVFAHPNVPRGARFYLHEGPWLLVGPLEIHHDLDPPLPAAAELRHTRLGADGQRQAGYAPTAPFRTSLGAPGIATKVVRGPGSSTDLGSDWQGADGGPVAQLWDTQTNLVSVAGEAMMEGLDTYWLRYEPLKTHGDEAYYDCVAVVAHVVTVR